jgi:saccharopine dehydrogenase-like NADP-dependent oxidoreductase
MSAVVVLGGYGNFGRRAAAALARERGRRVYIAGRDVAKAKAAAAALEGDVEPIGLDCSSPELAAQLHRIGANVVLHTAGPFQTQQYHVPRACIEAGAHYIDLADSRAYVCGIHALDRAARERNVFIVSGASSLPALSSAVVDSLAQGFTQLDSIEHSITSGAKPPGLATMQGVLGYAGKPFTQWREGEWRMTFGWQDLKRAEFPSPVGNRWLAACDVPDLELFPQRYPPVRTVTFRAGVAFDTSMLTIWAASWMVRAGLMQSLSAHAQMLRSAALMVERIGSKSSAMRVIVHGRDDAGRSASRSWTLLADQDHGPEIPCFPAIALARKALRNELAIRGATPCMGLLTVEEILEEGRGLAIRTHESL